VILTNLPALLSGDIDLLAKPPSVAAKKVLPVAAVKWLLLTTYAGEVR
jgi:hypothetical protein